MQYMMTQQQKNGEEGGDAKKDDMSNPYAFQQQFYAWQQTQMANGTEAGKGEDDGVKDDEPTELQHEQEETKEEI